MTFNNQQISQIKRKSLISVKRRQGFSLVELLVALLLGSLISAAGIQLLLTSSQSYRLQNGMSEVQEGGRFSIEYMIRDIRLAGHGMGGAAGGGDCGWGEFVTETNGKQSPIRIGTTDSPESLNDVIDLWSGNASDVLVVHRCAVSVDDTTCLGRSVNDGVLIVSEYYVKNRNLYCKDKTAGASVVGKLVSGVESFQVLYGVRGTNDYHISSYKTVNNIPADSNVSAIQLGLLLTSEQYETEDGATPVTLSVSRSYDLLDKVGITVNDESGLISRKFTTTVELRNAPRKLQI
ncbi:MAG: PilW family protein [Pseudomonadales bacterium]|nr:PilW family protein [Pseudomonadales bacterium]